MNRRSFLTNSAFATAFLGLSKHLAAGPAGRLTNPYGALLPDPNGLLDLPEGFSYRIISETGQRMSDGYKVPGMPDGMAAFASADGKTVLVRNHELALATSQLGPLKNNLRIPKAMPRDHLFDAGNDGEPPHVGGTTTIVIDPASGKVEEQFLSLCGTDRNCAGGAMPWGSWITCEESDDLTSSRGRNHGYCFEVQAAPGTGLQKARPLRLLGRYRHEAVALDPATGILYLTEDQSDGLLYRFVPDQYTPGQAVDFDQGKLQALVIKDQPSRDLRNYDPEGEKLIREGEPMEVSWIDLEGVDTPADDLRERGFRAGAARFARGEGIHYDDGSFFICATDGGPGRQGQLFKLTPGDPETLTLFLQPTESDLLTNGDNLTAAPWGDLIVCEDLIDEHGHKTPHVRGITREGKVYTLARNALNNAEFAGSTFSPDGKTLFVNIQSPGHTLAITGPWQG